MSQAGQTIDHGSETIALLQDEIARLEAELEARDEALRNVLIDAPAPVVREDESAGARLAELQAELDERDRLIVVLLEEGRLYEEAAEAQKQEWRQLSDWVEQVERRVEGRESVGADVAEALERGRREADEARRDWASDRRAWEAERGAMAQELTQLRERLASYQAGQSADAAHLDRENQRLRASLQEAARHVVVAEEVGPLREQLGQAMAEIERLTAAQRRESDERARESMEQEATIRGLQAKLARMAAESPAATAASGPAAEAGDGAEAYRQVDERIRAFRQHLRELHEREEAERTSRSLTSRLSRLWRHTSPD